ncbi:hypothetical protein LCGC14_2334330 [marine sediment metagenome]|uniref:Uncharacterized protein n=1 Tax=marine sediment metagenome TaxID=412755 RepID=A0A0F9ERM3_9ZZZZ
MNWNWCPLSYDCFVCDCSAEREFEAAFAAAMWEEALSQHVELDFGGIE